MTNRPLALRYVARLSACCLLVGLLPALAEVQIIPQVADGGGWSTTIVLSNKTTASQPVTLRFNGVRLQTMERQRLGHRRSLKVCRFPRSIWPRVPRCSCTRRALPPR